MPTTIVVPGQTQAVGTVGAGVVVTAVALGAIGGLLLARALVERRPTRSCLRTFASLVVIAVGARATLPLVETVALFHTLATLLDAVMIALTVATLWVARARKRELGVERQHSSR